MIRPMRRSKAALSGGLFLGLTLAGAATATSPDWTAEKCRRYARAWQMGRAGVVLSEAFVAAQEDFLAAGCSIRGSVCPQSPAEWALADRLTLMMVMEGATGSFLPFHCD